MLKIVGYQRSTGSFVPEDGKNKGQSIEYDNVKLFFINDTVKNVSGFATGELKIPVDKFEAITGVPLKEADFLLDQEVTFDYELQGKFPVLTSVRTLA